MANPVLRLGDRGEEVRRLQLLLNKVGGMLPGSDRFGALTESAVKDAQHLAGFPRTGDVGAALWDWLERQPAPSPDLGTRSVAFIAEMEVGGRGLYEAQHNRPHWPGSTSGITIGIGYDLKEQAADFEEDWKSQLDETVIARLRPHLGKTGSGAAKAALADISIPLRGAWQCFVVRTLPRYVALTRTAFGGPLYDALPDACRGALVSLVYNRGAAMEDEAGRKSRAEMRAIRDLIASGNLEDVSPQFREMKKLWGKDDEGGLVLRREAEAALWEMGLAESNATAVA